MKDDRLVNAGQIDSKGLVERIRPFVVFICHLYGAFFAGGDIGPGPFDRGAAASCDYGKDVHRSRTDVGYFKCAADRTVSGINFAKVVHGAPEAGDPAEIFLRRCRKSAQKRESQDNDVLSHSCKVKKYILWYLIIQIQYRKFA